MNPKANQPIDELAQKDRVDRLIEILKILSSAPSACPESIACFLLNPRSRLGGLSALDALASKNPALAEVVKRLAIESHE